MGDGPMLLIVQATVICFGWVVCKKLDQIIGMMTDQDAASDDAAATERQEPRNQE